jgi:signal peptidase II
MFTTRRDRLFLSMVFGILVADIITKRIAQLSLPLHQPRPVIGDVLRWTLTYNTGAAMNMTLGASSRVVFSVLAVVMILVIVKMWRGLPATSSWLAAALGMITAGATGNLIDRVRSAQGVVDFIDVGVGATRFWTFNVADSGVTVGAIILALLTWHEPTDDEKKNAPSAGAEDETPPPLA